MQNLAVGLCVDLSLWQDRHWARPMAFLAWVSWQLVRLFKNDYPASIWVGVGAQCPNGAGMSAVFSGLALDGMSIADFRMGI